MQNFYSMNFKRFNDDNVDNALYVFTYMVEKTSTRKK